MESTSIDGLFQQIFNSEQAAQRRKDQLNECKQNVHLSQEKVKSLQRECSELYRSLEQKLCELSDKELKSKSLRIQEKIFTQQKEELQHDIDHLVQTEKEIQAEYFENQKQFCEELEHICSSVGPSGYGVEERTDKFSEELNILIKEKADLKAGLQQHSEKQKIVDDLTEEKQALLNQLKSTVGENQKIKLSLFDVLECTEKLEEERKRLSDQPHTGPTVVSVQLELGTEKELAQRLDNELYHLQAQLQQAHQQLWQRQVQQRQQAQVKRRHDTAEVTSCQGSQNHETTSDEWEGSDMDLLMDDFTDDNVANLENVQQFTSNARPPAQRKSIFKPGNKLPVPTEDN